MRTKELFPQRIEGVRTPRAAEPETLILCKCEEDAVKASIALSGLSYGEIGARIGVSKQAVEKWVRKGLSTKPDRTVAFQNATGTRLLTQYRELERMRRAEAGQVRERDRIAAIVAPTQQTWASYGRAAA